MSLASSLLITLTSASGVFLAEAGAAPRHPLPWQMGDLLAISPARVAQRHFGAHRLLQASAKPHCRSARCAGGDRPSPCLVPLLTKKDPKPQRYIGFLVNTSTRRRLQRWAAPNYLPGSILHGGTRIISSGYLRGMRNTHILSASAACRRYHTLCLLLS